MPHTTGRSGQRQERHPDLSVMYCTNPSSSSGGWPMMDLTKSIFRQTQLWSMMQPKFRQGDPPVHRGRNQVRVTVNAAKSLTPICIKNIVTQRRIILSSNPVVAKQPHRNPIIRKALFSNPYGLPWPPKRPAVSLFAKWLALVPVPSASTSKCSRVNPQQNLVRLGALECGIYSQGSPTFNVNMTFFHT